MNVMTYSEDRALRKQTYDAYLTRASEEGGATEENDNAPVLERILELKKQQAELLGYSNYAEVSMSKKMATLDKALDLLNQLLDKSKQAAVDDMAELNAFAK